MMLWMEEMKRMCYYNLFFKMDQSSFNFLHQNYNRLWIPYLDFTRGYLQFDMLLAMVSLINKRGAR